MEGTIADWQQDEVSKAETELVPLNDPGVGKEVVLRHFFFKSDPVTFRERRPTKQEIVSQFKHMIEMSLWGDGLIIREDRQLEVHTRQKAKQVSKSLYMKMLEEKADFVILCLAEPRSSQIVHDKAHTL